MAADQLKLTQLAGSAIDCGASYGARLRTQILGFTAMEIKPDRRKLTYARRCWSHVERDAPTAAQFMRGLARGVGVGLDLITLLSLHEELAHKPHCSAFVTGCGRRGLTLNAQNWDWSMALYPWPGLLELAIAGGPRVLSYHFPGLWSCAGVNDAGLTLMWTGSGYSPPTLPATGLPTYVVIAEVLRRGNVEQALSYLNEIQQAGSFIFLLGDAAGNTAVVEGMPGRLAVERTGPIMTRTNHYRCQELIAGAKQQLSRRRNFTSCHRARRLTELVKAAGPRLSVAAARRILTDRDGEWPWLHVYSDRSPSLPTLGMTIDSLLAVAQDRALHTARGGLSPGKWRVHTL